MGVGLYTSKERYFVNFDEIDQRDLTLYLNQTKRVEKVKDIGSKSEKYHTGKRKDCVVMDLGNICREVERVNDGN